MVYFIRQGNHPGPIKIGHALDPIGRMRELQVANPETLHLLRVLNGDQPEEDQLHQKFRACNIRGEWFRPEEVLKFLAATSESMWEKEQADKKQQAEESAKQYAALTRLKDYQNNLWPSEVLYRWFPYEPESIEVRRQGFLRWPSDLLSQIDVNNKPIFMLENRNIVFPLPPTIAHRYIKYDQHWPFWYWNGYFILVRELIEKRERPASASLNWDIHYFCNTIHRIQEAYSQAQVAAVFQNIDRWQKLHQDTIQNLEPPMAIGRSRGFESDNILFGKPYRSIIVPGDAFSTPSLKEITSNWSMTANEILISRLQSALTPPPTP